jgi:hypothetical protein
MGTPSVTWDAAYEATPAGTDDPRAADDRMREMKLADRERLEREHGFATSEASARHGVHRKGSARASYATGDPTTVPDGTSTRALNSTDDDGRLHVDATSKALRFYDGSAWQSAVADGGIHLKKIDIGDWNLYGGASSLSVAHGLTVSKIINVTAVIRNDADTIRITVPDYADSSGTALALSGLFVSGANVVLKNYQVGGSIGGILSYLLDMGIGSGYFTDWDATSYNRGWIFVWYTD